MVRAYQRGMPEEGGQEPGNGGLAPGPKPGARPPAQGVPDDLSGVLLGCG